MEKIEMMVEELLSDRECFSAVESLRAELSATE